MLNPSDSQESSTGSTRSAPPRKKAGSVSSKLIAWLHLWPGIVSALILIPVCIAGTIVVYCDEITDWSAGKALYAKEVRKERLPTEALLAAFKEKFPQRGAPGYLVHYRDEKRSIKFNTWEDGAGLRFVYMDPYTGEVLKDDATVHFFYVMAHFHADLGLGETGHWIVDLATIVFVLELITGLVLWWPRKWTKATRDASFKVKWKARFKRLNYDLHNVLGFYTLAIALVLSVTGLIIAFEPLADFTIAAFGGDPGHEWEDKYLPRYEAGKKGAPIDSTTQWALNTHPSSKAVQIATYDLDSTGNYYLVVASQLGLKSYVGQLYFIDRYSGKKVELPASAIRHDEVQKWYWLLHMGTWMGWLGKLVTFTGGLIATTLPVTGFLIWWGRRNKKKPLKKAPTSPSVA